MQEAAHLLTVVLAEQGTLGHSASAAIEKQLPAAFKRHACSLMHPPEHVGSNL